MEKTNGRAPTVLVGAARDRFRVFTGADPRVRRYLNRVIGVLVESGQDDRRRRRSPITDFDVVVCEKNRAM